MDDNQHNKAGGLSEVLWGGQIRAATASGSAAAGGAMYLNAGKGPLRAPNEFYMDILAVWKRLWLITHRKSRKSQINPFSDNMFDENIVRMETKEHVITCYL